MTSETERPLRADAARNVGRIVSTARAAFAELGPHASFEEIARRADVGLRTLYRRFPSMDDLVRAVLTQSIAEQVLPAIEAALADPDPKRGLVTVMEASLSMFAAERNAMTAAGNSGSLAAEVTAPIIDALNLLARRAQDAGLVRGDLTSDDMFRIMSMLAGVLWDLEPGDQGWRRYLALLLDALHPAAATPLPPAGPGRSRPSGAQCSS